MEKLKEVVLHIDYMMSKFNTYRTVLDIEGIKKPEYINDDYTSDSLFNFDERYNYIEHINIEYWDNDNNSAISFDINSSYNNSNKLHIKCHFIYISKNIRFDDHSKFQKIFRSYEEMDEFIPRVVAFQNLFNEVDLILTKACNNTFKV